MTNRQLQPDYEDSNASVLPSFPSIRQRTLDTLYPELDKNDDTDSPAAVPRSRLDRSPKGSVDEHIQDLVDLINQHPSYATLSSCSGRISLFDPQLRRQGLVLQNHEASLSSANGATGTRERMQHNELLESEVIESDDGCERNQPSAAPTSGKGGGGGWLLVSHDVVDDTAALVKVLDDNQASRSHDQQNSNDSYLAFKVEPMLLHVAASSLERGQQLLQVALRSGFRESGLVVSPSRVTVAVRSHSLALHVPLSSHHGPMRPPNEYLIALMDEANRRLRVNMSRIHALYDEIEASLFRPTTEPVPPDYHSRLSFPNVISGTRIPDLNLWGHTAVAVPESPAAWSLLAIGGYGEGPKSLSSDAPTSQQRSGSVFRLKMKSMGEWCPSWDRLETTHGGSGVLAALKVDVQAAPFGPREGLASCVVASASSEWLAVTDTVAVVLLFGGRTSPSKPLNELLLCEYRQSLTVDAVSMFKPVDVRGQPPSPRWGHTVTSLTPAHMRESDCRLAVVFGGRNETDALDSMHVLSLITEQRHDKEPKRHFAWDTVIVSGIPSQVRRLHHDSFLFHDRLFVMGGLESPGDLLAPFRAESCFDATPLAVEFSLDLASSPMTAKRSFVNVDESCSAQLRRFGHRASLLEVHGNEGVVVVSGGVPMSCHGYDDDYDDEEESPAPSPLMILQLFVEPGQKATVEWRRDVDWVARGDSFDLGTLVHHDACFLLSTGSNDSNLPQLAVVGGGVPGFGFQPCFAHSYAFTSTAAAVSARTRTSESQTRATQPCGIRQPTTTTTTNGSREANSLMPVVHVSHQDAKSFKEWLRGRGWLDLTVRMAPTVTGDGLDRPEERGVAASSEGSIAVPMTPEGWGAFEEHVRCNGAWWDNGDAPSMSSARPEGFALVRGRGRQVLPPSTRTHARHCANPRKSEQAAVERVRSELA